MQYGCGGLQDNGVNLCLHQSEKRFFFMERSLFCWIILWHIFSPQFDHSFMSVPDLSQFLLHNFLLYHFDLAWHGMFYVGVVHTTGVMV
jgi:hypothetical protein